MIKYDQITKSGKQTFLFPSVKNSNFFTKSLSCLLPSKLRRSFFPSLSWGKNAPQPMDR